MKGVVVRFDVERGYGLIRPDGRTDRVFVHVSDLPKRQPLDVGRLVTFDEVPDRRTGGSRTKAINVVPGRRQRDPVRTSLALAVIASVMLCVALVVGLGLHWFLGWLAAVNIVTFALYGIDKLSARLGRVRTPELTLQLAALVGGSPAAYLGQRAFDHKSSERNKAPFRRMFRRIVTLQVVVVFVFAAGALLLLVR